MNQQEYREAVTRIALQQERTRREQEAQQAVAEAARLTEDHNA